MYAYEKIIYIARLFERLLFQLIFIEENTVQTRNSISSR